MFPEVFDTAPLRRAIDDGLDWVIANWGAGFETAAYPLQWTLNMIERGLLATPWWAVVAVLVGLAFVADAQARPAAAGADGAAVPGRARAVGRFDQDHGADADGDAGRHRHLDSRWAC